MFVLGVPDNPVQVDIGIFSWILIRQLIGNAVVDLKFPKDVSSIEQNVFKIGEDAGSRPVRLWKFVIRNNIVERSSW